MYDELIELFDVFKIILSTFEDELWFKWGWGGGGVEGEYNNLTCHFVF